MKMRPVGAELLHADGHRDGRTDRQADLTKLRVALLSFVKASVQNASPMHDSSSIQPRNRDF